MQFLILLYRNSETLLHFQKKNVSLQFCTFFRVTLFLLIYLINHKTLGMLCKRFADGYLAINKSKDYSGLKDYYCMI